MFSCIENTIHRVLDIYTFLTEELNSCLSPWVRWPKVKDASCTTLFLTKNSIGTKRKVK